MVGGGGEDGAVVGQQVVDLQPGGRRAAVPAPGSSSASPARSASATRTSRDDADIAASFRDERDPVQASNGTWADLGEAPRPARTPRVGGGLRRLCTAQSMGSGPSGTDTQEGATAWSTTGPDGGRAFAVHVFGHTTVHTPDRTLRASDFTGVKPRQILELIALGRGEPVRKAAIAEQIWAGRPPRRWQVTLESYVALLRRAIQPGVPGRATVLCTTPGGYRLDIERVGIDLHDFEPLVRRAAHAAPEDALPLWERAVEIADGTLLATEPYAAWAVDARRTHERVLHAAAAAGPRRR